MAHWSDQETDRKIQGSEMISLTGANLQMKSTQKILNIKQNPVVEKCRT